MVQILPSVLASDFSILKEEIKSMEENGADMFHLDVMDGQFVPNISYGFPIIKSIRKHSNLPLDVHLMTLTPEQFIDELADIGVEMISFHIETTFHPHRLIQKIKSKNIKAGVAINPHTPIEAIQHLLSDLDFILVMSVNPGFGGQSFIKECLVKIHKLNEMKQTNGYHYEIEVDGGINTNTAKDIIDSGATMLVSGSYLYQSKDRRMAIESLRSK